ncbi:unnamed protein product [Mucor hiemalis]
MAEEYEVQAIASHKIVRVGKKPTLQYEIKWKGYKSSENTWESSKATENAQDLVDKYWDTKGGGQVAREKVERLLRGESSDDEEVNSEYSEEEEKEEYEEEDDDEEEEVVRKPSKSSRKRVASPVTKRTPSKRAKTSTDHRSKQNKSQKSKKVVVEEESDNETDFSESEIEKGDFRAKSNNWKTDVEKIISVRNHEDDNELYALVRWRDGKIGLNKTSVVAQKNPHILIKYYEKRLAFEKRD